MRILHICNDFCGSKVHSNLYKELDALGISQTIFACFRGDYPDDTNKFEAISSDFIYRGNMSVFYRAFFHVKVRKVYRVLISELDPKQYDLVHAATLFTDGVVALELYRRYKIPYLVSVRNTDVNSFLTFAPHTWYTGMNVLRDAKKVVFISKALKEKFCNHVCVKQILPEIESKFVVAPNGVDDYWINNINNKDVNLNHSILYVGRFNTNKNVGRLIDAVLELKQEINDIQLHLVGGGGNKEKKIISLVSANRDCIEYHGRVYDKDELCAIYRRSSIFAMPSIHETFGLVYIEALTQNLAVLYTQHQGIDGLYDNHIGESVNALSVKSIKNALRKMLLNRSYYNASSLGDFSSFRWDKIALNYKKMYEEIV